MRGDLKALIAAAYPDRSDITISALAEIEHGWETTIYRFDLSYEEGSAKQTRPLVAKLYPGPGGDAKAAREAAVLKAVGRAGLPVPRIELVSDSTLVMGRATGALLATQITEAGVAGMAQLLADLHRVPVNSVFTDGLDPFSDPAFVEPDPGAMSIAIERFGLHDYRPLIDWLTTSPSRTSPPARSTTITTLRTSSLSRSLGNSPSSIGALPASGTTASTLRGRRCGPGPWPVKPLDHRCYRRMQLPPETRSGISSTSRG